jgi:hypothetical protein
MGSANGTTVYLNGVSQGTVNAGTFLTMTLGGGNVITSTAPIHVMQFARSNSVSGGNGDPAQIALVPTTMFYNNFRFTTLVHSNVSSHYVTVISRAAGAASVRLDGTPMTFTNFGSGWAFASRAITGGEHVLYGDSLMHGVLVGWGGVNSYGLPIPASTSPILPLGDIPIQGEATETGNLVEWQCPLDWSAGDVALERAQDISQPQVVYAGGSKADGHYLDTQVKAGETWLYRAVYQGAGGDVAHSEWLSLTATATPAALRIHPNPVLDDLHVQIPVALEGAVDIDILDAAGRHVYSTSLPSVGSELTLPKVCSTLAPGLYTLSLRNGAQRFQVNFVHP